MRIFSAGKIIFWLIFSTDVMTVVPDEGELIVILDHSFHLFMKQQRTETWRPERLYQKTAGFD